MLKILFFRWILTAAHCYTNKLNKIKLKVDMKLWFVADSNIHEKCCWRQKFETKAENRRRI